ncbi:SLBB domain-containing protein [Thermoproteota archaeon]
MTISIKKIVILSFICLFGISIVFTSAVAAASDEDLVKVIRELPSNEQLELLSPVERVKILRAFEKRQDVLDELEAAVTSSLKEKSATKDAGEDGVLIEPEVLSRIEKLYQRDQLYDTFLMSTFKDGLTIPTESLYSEYDEVVKQFGYDVFAQAEDPQFGLTDVPVGPNYILGPGDQLLLRIWGKLEEIMEVTVSPEGSIYIPQVGTVFVSGERLDRAKRIIQKELERFYVNFEISVTLKELRAVKVFVLGDVVRPGAYDVSSLSTMFRGLYSAGGPTKLGSLRKIYIKRSNQTVKEIDLYHYLIKGDRNQDPRLEADDTIFVPPIGDVVKISGMVKRPAIFEIKPGTSVYDGLTQLAAGLSINSYYKRMQLHRIQDGERRIVMDLSFESLENMRDVLKGEVLINGDHLIVLPLLDLKHNFVSIQGNVYRPGNYAFKKGMMLKELFSNLDGFKQATYFKRIEVYRYVSDEIRQILKVDYTQPEAEKFELKDWDIIRIYSETEVLGIPYVSIEGAVHKPGPYKLMDTMTAGDLVFIAGVTKNVADLNKVEVYRKTEEDQETLVRLDLSAIFEKITSENAFLLRRDDRVFVRENHDLMTLRTIKLSGEVMFPGFYPVRENERISSIIERAGGYTDKAFLKGAVLQRMSVRERTIVNQRKILDKERKRLIYDQSRFVSVQSDEAQRVFQQALSFLEERIQENMGRLVIHLKPLDKFTGTFYDIRLEDQDELHIPAIPEDIQIIGGVQYATAMLYEENKSTNYYIDKAGGFGEFADRGHVLVLKANGTVLENAANIERGDIIYVPEQVVFHVNWFEVLVKTVQLMYNVAASYHLVFN